METKVRIILRSGYSETLVFRYHQAAVDAYHALQICMGTEDTLYKNQDERISFTVRGSSIDFVSLE